MNLLERTARKLGHKMLMMALEVNWLTVALGGEGLEEELIEGAYMTLDLMHYSEPIYTTGECIKVILMYPIFMPIAAIVIRIKRWVLRMMAEEA